MADEQTLVLLKPDGVQRGLAGAVISRIERRGLRLVGLKLTKLDRALAERHYDEHREKPFFSELVDFITSAPVVAMVWEGPKAVELVRSMMGATDPARALPGTIRGDYAISIGQNVVHGSDSVARAAVEVRLFFEPEEIVLWRSDQARWVSGG